MQSVTVKELRARLGHYLGVVERGASLVVTLGGRPLARLEPVARCRPDGLPPDLDERMWALVAEGFIVWKGEPSRMPEPGAVNRGPTQLSDLLVEDRE
jgi:prevent-host-death family protein